jgi:hypothetical protein
MFSLSQSIGVPEEGIATAAQPRQTKLVLPRIPRTTFLCVFKQDVMLHGCKISVVDLATGRWETHQGRAAVGSQGTSQLTKHEDGIFSTISSSQKGTPVKTLSCCGSMEDQVWLIAAPSVCLFGSRISV